MGLASAVKLAATTNAVEILTTLRHPTELVRGGDALFALDADTENTRRVELVDDVVSIPLAGGSPKTIAAAQQGAQGLSFAGGRLVWTLATVDADENAAAKIMGVKIGGTPAALASTYALDDTSTVADGADVYAFSEVKDGKSDLIRITGNAKPVRVAPIGARAVRTAIATNASHVLWIQGDAIVRAPKGGGAASIVAKVTAANVQRIVADDAHVYWTDHGRGDSMWMGRVYQASLEGGTVTPISDVETPTGIALDADTVYWTSLGGGRILARKKSGGDTFVLARDQHGPFAIVVDDRHVYWTNVSDGTVCRADKTPRAQP